MATIYGVPLIGSAFVPVLVGAVTIFLLWNYMISRKHVQLSEEKLKDYNSVSSFNEAQSRAIPKRKKSCGNKKKGCCGGGKSKGGSCSSRIGSIESLKVILDKESNLNQEVKEILSQRSHEMNLACDFINLPQDNLDSFLLNETLQMSLCTFIFNDYKSNELLLWLESAISSKSKQSKPLSGMKYAVFRIQENSSQESSTVHPDQCLHKLGAVRVCKAGVANMASDVMLEGFRQWTQELVDRVLMWNEPKKVACKCIGKDDGCEKGSCSGSSSCSESGEEAVEEIDLEDIGRILGVKT